MERQHWPDWWTWGTVEAERSLMKSSLTRILGQLQDQQQQTPEPQKHLQELLGSSSVEGRKVCVRGNVPWRPSEVFRSLGASPACSYVYLRLVRTRFMICSHSQPFPLFSTSPDLSNVSQSDDAQTSYQCSSKLILFEFSVKYFYKLVKWQKTTFLMIVWVQVFPLSQCLTLIRLEKKSAINDNTWVHLNSLRWWMDFISILNFHQLSRESGWAQALNMPVYGKSFLDALVCWPGYECQRLSEVSSADWCFVVTHLIFPTFTSSIFASSVLC